jgi:hypothetical protein
MTRALGVVGVALAFAFGSAEAGQATGADHGLEQTRIPDIWQKIAVAHALDAAFRRIADPRCRELFDAFADRSGRTLQQVLDVEGRTAQSHLRLLAFRDGNDMKPCQRSSILAFTKAGSHVVFVCGPRFRRVFEDDRRIAQATIIHEALHSLGLGENPPTSAEITNAVLTHCF